jgi:hypothetical protein
MIRMIDDTNNTPRHSKEAVTMENDTHILWDTRRNGLDKVILMGCDFMAHMILAGTLTPD